MLLSVTTVTVTQLQLDSQFCGQCTRTVCKCFNNKTKLVGGVHCRHGGACGDNAVRAKQNGKESF